MDFLELAEKRYSVRAYKSKPVEDEKLQQLPEGFIEELNEYLKKKQGMADQREMKNIRNTVERLFELRENKITGFALYNVRTCMPVENLTQKEEELFKKLVEELKKFRKNIFSSLEKDKSNESKSKQELFRVKKDIPAIVGPDLKEYKLSENEIIDISALPKELNELLLKKGVIERVE